MGDRPMQLNYSRAFGGKDLKMYGLSVHPDVKTIQLKKSHRVVVLASDGLWDVVSQERACRVALEEHAQGRHAAEALVNLGLSQLQAVGSVDNVTVVCVFFN